MDGGVIACRSRLKVSHTEGPAGRTEAAGVELAPGGERENTL